MLGAKDREIALEYEVLCDVRNRVSNEVVRLQKTAKALAVLDVLLSLAEVAVTNNYTCPQINTDGVIDIKDGRHPVVEALLDGAPFVPNDTLLDKDKNRCSIITGPNMAGKSTYMRQIALIVLMAQIGSFVPARSANIGITDAIFTRVGASDDLATGQSTFMVEMNETAFILNSATEKSLILLDEIGRGTSTYDGVAIAWSVAEYIATNIKARTIFATHYHELNVMSSLFPQIKNYRVTISENDGDIIFLRKVIEGSASKSYGIQVAKMAGLPRAVIKTAEDMMTKMQIDYSKDLSANKRKSKVPTPDVPQLSLVFGDKD